MVYIFDIDGTLANLEHRLHHINTDGQPKKDWAAFFADCDKDAPIKEVIKTCQDLASNNYIVLITGRTEDIRAKTIDWLSEQGIEYDGLYMRKTGDNRQDNIVKSELLDKFLSDWKMKIEKEEILGVFEDRQQVVDMYRARGLRVFQVAPGNF